MMAVSSLVGLALLVPVQFVGAQELGDSKAGRAFAEQVCSECHAVRPGEHVSPNEKAPAFHTIAETPGMGEMALRVWFQTAHPSMPNLIIRDKRADDLIAYILSLKGTRN